MSALPRDSRGIIKKLLSEGWYEVGQEGSHRHFKHPTIKGKLTVPHPKKDFPVGTLKKIYKFAGWVQTQPACIKEIDATQRNTEYIKKQDTKTEELINEEMETWK